MNLTSSSDAAQDEQKSLFLSMKTRGPIQRNTVSLNGTGHSRPVPFSETVFLWIGPLFRRIGPPVSPDGTFSKTNTPILKKHLVYVTSASSKDLF